MKKKEVLVALKKICDAVSDEIEDLDLEVFPNNVCDREHEIGSFFINEDETLCFGTTSGNVYYYPLGDIAKLKEISYRHYPEDGMVEFVFDFGDYMISVEHTAFQEEFLRVFDKQKGSWSMPFKAHEFRKINETLNELIYSPESILREFLFKNQEDWPVQFNDICVLVQPYIHRSEVIDHLLDIALFHELDEETVTILKKHFDLKRLDKYIQRLNEEYEDDFLEKDREQIKEKAIALYSKMINSETEEEKTGSSPA